jgi:hypothetical protein
MVKNYLFHLNPSPLVAALYMVIGAAFTAFWTTYAKSPIIKILYRLYTPYSRPKNAVFPAYFLDAY